MTYIELICIRLEAILILSDRPHSSNPLIVIQTFHKYLRHIPSRLIPAK